MNGQWKKWLPMLVCCAPVLLIGAAVGAGIVSVSALSRWAVLLACPIGMGLMMWLMNKNMGDHASQTAPDEQTPNERLTALRQQRQTLESEIAETTHMVELEAERERMPAAQSFVADKVGASNVAVQS